MNAIQAAALRRACDLALTARGDVEPNPPVGAVLLVGLQAGLYYVITDVVPEWGIRRNILFKTFLTGTAALHFFYDGIIWRQSKPVNSWTL